MTYIKPTYLLIFFFLFQALHTTEKHPIIFQLSAPRSGSTALLHSFSQNPEWTILHEPTTKPFDKIHYAELTKTWFKEPHLNATFEEVKNLIFQLNTTSPIYIKDMIFSSYQWLMQDQNFISNEEIKFILLIRNPYDTLLSFYKKTHGRDCDLIATSYRQIWEFTSFLKENVSENRFMIVCSEEVFANSDMMLRNIYNHFGLSFDPKALSWKPKNDDFDGSEWQESKRKDLFLYWHGDALKSNGFKPLKTSTPDFKHFKEEDKELMKSIYQDALGYYNKLKDAIQQ